MPLGVSPLRLLLLPKFCVHRLLRVFHCAALCVLSWLALLIMCTGMSCNRTTLVFKAAHLAALLLRGG
jgi:hypothetical protein